MSTGYRPIAVWHPSLDCPEHTGRLVLAMDGSRFLLPLDDGNYSRLAWVEAEECKLIALYFNDEERWSMAFLKAPIDPAAAEPLRTVSRNGGP